MSYLPAKTDEFLARQVTAPRERAAPSPAGRAASPADRDAPPPERTGAGGRPARLVVVSNRVPAPGNRNAGAGGLAVALQAALTEHGGIWFGWSGEARPMVEADAVHVQQDGRITYAVTDLTKRDVDEYYAGFSNRALWPVCHYRLDLARFSGRETEAYFRVNERFGRQLARMVESGDLIWVHDYHLLPLGEELRRRGVDGPIGFFLHIPWPPAEVASALPEYRRLLAAATAYDVIGFQTPGDAENFGRCLVEAGIASPSGDGWFESGARRFRIGAFPISIDTEAFRKAAVKAVAQPAVRKLTAALGEQRLVIGVDRLDYSKGIRERIRSFCSFVNSNPEERGRVSYLQVTPKSRSDVAEYRQIEREVAAQVGEANGALGDVDWTPIRYINRNLPHATLTGLYRLAKVGLVTPLRDGMNLVAKEYVASQSEDDPGVLVLSQFAGAAHELGGALVVNPYDAVETAGAISRALTMGLRERRERWAGMMTHLATHDVSAWWRSFLSAMEAVSSETTRANA